MKFCENSKRNNPCNPLDVPLTGSFMAQNQLIDSLTSHISLYSSHSLVSSPKPNPNPRSAILKWFSSLTVAQRQAHLTVVDSKFTRIIMQMLGRLRRSGHGSFIILPDLPSGDLPGLCYKKSCGLIARASESNEYEGWIFESTRLFGSREGESLQECSCSVSCLDSISVSEDFVANPDRFVETMDKLSNGAFLRGEESDLGSDWVELDWLKNKGYYTIEAFIANRLEVSLRLAWLNCNSGKKRVVKLKEKLNGAGVAANVYYRKKGCVDWWTNLDPATRKKVWTTLLGKAAKSLEVLTSTQSASPNEAWLYEFGKGPMRYRCTSRSQRLDSAFVAETGCSMTIEPDPDSRSPVSFTNALNRLLVLQDVIRLVLAGQNSEFTVQKVFFSSLSSISTIVDCILRKLRGLLMVVSVGYTKSELLEVFNCKQPSDTSKGKPDPTTRKKKGKPRNTKKPNHAADSGLDGHSRDKDAKGDHRQLNPNNEKGSELNKTNVISHKDKNETLQTAKKEHAQGPVAVKGRTTGKKNKREKKKKNLILNAPHETKDSEDSTKRIAPSFVAPQHKIGNSDATSNDVVIQNSSNINSKASGIHELTLKDGSSDGTSNALLIQNSYNITSRASGIHDLTLKDGSFFNQFQGKASSVHSNQDEISDGNTESFCCVDMESSKSINGTVLLESVPSRREVADSKVEHSLFPPSLNALKTAEPLANGDQNFTKMANVQFGITGEGESPIRQQQAKGEFYDASPSVSPEFFSYEWPAVAPVYFPSVNPHLLTATDRLHLDVGHTLHGYVRQPFVPTVHQVRNASIESGCKQVLPQSVPMSLDWPPVVHSGYGLAASLTCNCESGVISTQQATQDLGNECDGKWMSEEDFEMRTVSGIDYNQYFGGGVMYWNPSDHVGNGFSRPPSLSSDDSLWAWHEADLNRAVDDMVAFSSSYSTNGLSSPTAASFCSPFDPLGPANQPRGYVVSGNEVPGKVLRASGAITDTAGEEDVSGSLSNISGDVEGNSADSLSFPILRPIIIPNMSREVSKSEFRRGYDLKSPHVPPSRREQPRIKRPPSPVVLCVPRAPRPPPPSPVSESRKHRGFPIVRSGSSSPRHWGMKGRYHDGLNCEEGCLRVDSAEVVWPWRNKKLSVHPMIQPLPGALLQDHLIAMSQVAHDQEHPDVALPLQPPELSNSSTRKESLSMMHNILNDEIDSFCKKVFAENMVLKPYINWAVKRVTRSLQVLWPRSRTNIFGSIASGLSLPSSDVDLVVCLPPVRNLEPIKEAGILEGRNGIKETCLQHAARYLANQEWVKTDSLKTVENTAIPIIMLVVEVPCDLASSAVSNILSPKEDSACTTIDHSNRVHSDMLGSEDSVSPNCQPKDNKKLTEVKSVRLDISFKTPSHTGLQTTELVKDLTEQFPAATPLALVLKQFLADRSLDQAYSGGLSSYCLILLITRFLQHEHHLGRPINQNFGSLLMDFLYFFGNVFDPRQMRISVQGTGVYRNRERGYSIDPIHIDDPLCPTNNVGRNCFRIHQCIKAFSEAYSTINNELPCLPNCGDSCSRLPYKLLPKIVPSIGSS